MFIQFSGWACDDAAYKLAVLTLRHKCAVAIQAEFTRLKHQYEKEDMSWVLSWQLGRLGPFIVDTIRGTSVTIGDVHKGGLMTRGRTHNTCRNDCCQRSVSTAHLCSWCKIATCDGCLRHAHTNTPCRYTGVPWPECMCGRYMIDQRQNRLYPKRGASYMVEVLEDEDGVWELQPVFPRGCFRQGKHPERIWARHSVRGVSIVSRV